MNSYSERAPFPASLPPRYRPVRVIGTGAMGVVVLAQDLAQGRLVAIKTLRTDCADYLARLEREAATLAGLDHPSIVRVHDLGLHAERLYLSMEYAAGGNLALAELEPVPLVRTLRRVVDALGHAHAQGIVHRDVKPENVLLARRDDGSGAERPALLSDFGLACGPDEGSATLRRPIVGTPLSMSPEQVAGEPVGPASDVFSLGVTLYVKLAGVWPFRGRGVGEVFDAILHKDAPRFAELADGPRRPVPRRLESIVRKALEKDPSARFASMHELGLELDRFLGARTLFSVPISLLGEGRGERRRAHTLAEARRIHPEDHA